MPFNCCELSFIFTLLVAWSPNKFYCVNSELRKTGTMRVPHNVHQKMTNHSFAAIVIRKEAPKQRVVLLRRLDFG